jgi:AcrB/AcrD/AcrF family
VSEVGSTGLLSAKGVLSRWDTTNQRDSRLKFSHFFIDRPIFAMALSILVVLAGGVAYLTLPVAQYPEIVPPTVQIQATYPGADPQVLADTVAAPIEEQVNGVENMLYMSSQMTSDGNVTIAVTFSLGPDIDTLVQHQSVARIWQCVRVNRIRFHPPDRESAGQAPVAKREASARRHRHDVHCWRRRLLHDRQHVRT